MLGTELAHTFQNAFFFLIANSQKQSMSFFDAKSLGQLVIVHESEIPLSPANIGI